MSSSSRNLRYFMISMLFAATFSVCFRVSFGSCVGGCAQLIPVLHHLNSLLPNALRPVNLHHMRIGDLKLCTIALLARL
jgi:hypothetical protein